MDGPPIANGTLLVDQGRIVAVGSQVAIPATASVHRLDGKVIMPGLVDTHSHIGQVAGADRSAPILGGCAGTGLHQQAAMPAL